MWKNYFIASYRFLKRYKGYTLLNLIGLSIGIASSIFIFLWVLDELNYDKHHKSYKNIYRLVQTQDNGYKVAATSAPYTPVLNELLPEIKEAFRIRPYPGELMFESNENKFYEKEVLFADSTILKVLTFDFISGDEHALYDLNSIVITESTAQKYFGNEDPFGQIIKLNNGTALKVTGVIKDIPKNSHIQFDMLLNFEMLVQAGWFMGWDNNFYYGYFLLENNVDIESLNYKFAKTLSKYISDNLGNNGVDRVRSEEDFPILWLQALEDIHLHSDFNIDLYSHTQPGIQYVYFFSIIGFVILIITAINYTNLAIARYTRRTIEVGIRKACGAVRSQLTGQFLFESIFLTLLAYLIGIFLVEIFIPQFNQFTDKNLSFSYTDWRIIVGAVSIILFTGIASGSYPALFLSSLSPINAIRGIEKKGSSNFRKILVIVQFIMGAILIISTLTVYKQLDFIQKKKLGFNKEHLIYITTKGDLNRKFDFFKNELKKTTDVLNVSYCSALPTYTVHSTTGFHWGENTENHNILLHRETIEQDYLETMGIELIAGRNYIENSSSDSANYIANETLIKRIGLKNPIDHEFTLWNRRGRIIGVMKDFNFKSLHKPVEPLLYHIGRRVDNYIMIRLKGNDVISEIETVKKVYEEINPAFPFDFHFLDADYNQLYKAEKMTGELFASFSIIAIFLACLGFFGLSSYMAEQRSKEIAVRKVFGSSPKEIGIKLIWSFTKWILLANIIAIPIAYYVLNSWLDKFAYRVSLGYQVFFLTITFTIIIAISAQLIQVIKAIQKNPADSLKYE